jgi:hypothetical protein
MSNEQPKSDPSAGVDVRQVNCPACGHHVAVRLLQSTDQPLATLAWPQSKEAAEQMKRLPLNFVCCVNCGHIFNETFEYSEVPYGHRPNLMFNRGFYWSEVIRNLQQELRQWLPPNPTVVEIGHGDGGFLHGLAEICERGKFVGFDPHGTEDGSELVQFRRELFLPSEHIAELRPDIIISRHVLEHLSNPLGFLQELSFTAALAGHPVLAYFEVPCVDRMLETGRTVDLYYEHSSQFTSSSFGAMLSRCDALIERIGHLYEREVIYGFVQLGKLQRSQLIAEQATSFLNDATKALETIHRQLDELAASPALVAIWGGTGKAAAFINRYSLDAERFPLVVDSDPDKVGTFVPGTGQEIQFRDVLKASPAHTIIVPPQWRARDILLEMQNEEIQFARILIEHEGELIDFLDGHHPYARS